MKKISVIIQSIVRGWLLLAILLVFIGYIAATFPSIQKAADGRVSLDSQLFYTPEEAFASIGSFAIDKYFWIKAYSTWDIVNPILYTTMFCFTISWLFLRGFPPGRKIHILNMMPIGAGIFDILENVFIIVMLSEYPRKLTTIAFLSSLCTILKIAILAASCVLIIIGILTAGLHRFKRWES